MPGSHAVRVHTPTAGGPTAALPFTHVHVLFLSDLSDLIRMRPA
jgi:hypothetical protein